jgi:membrane-associated phospholipid phosphatase
MRAAEFHKLHNMNYQLISLLGGAGLVFLILELLGVPVTLRLSFKGDIKRESQWLAQYGQAICTAIAVLLVWKLDPGRPDAKLVVVAASVAASVICFVIKRICGRARPNREHAGKFLGPTLKHDNARESFPSSHSASAVALSAALAMLYPPAAGIFWTLGIVCAALRYLMDAHWPSDVLIGITIGYACGVYSYLHWYR